MAYFLLNKETRKYERAPGFEKMFYIAPDVRYKEVDSDEELAAKFRKFLEAMWNFCGAYLDANWLTDYALVLTPLVCDSKFVEGQPKEKGNYIVTGFNYEEIDLVEKVIVKSQKSTGDDERPTLGFYVALEVSPDNPWLEDVADQPTDSADYNMAVFQAQMAMAQAIADEYYDEKIRVFAYSDDVGYFEQYFDRNVKTKTQKLHLGDGWFKCRLKAGDQYPSKCAKYVVAMDLFESTGSDFAQYGLGKDDLKAGRESFNEEPWVTIEYKE